MILNIEVGGQENLLYEWLGNEKVKGRLLQLKLVQVIFFRIMRGKLWLQIGQFSSGRCKRSCRGW